MSLPIFKTEDKDLMLLQTKWSNKLNPVIDSAINNGYILQSISLVSGANVVNHLLGRNLQGWMIARMRSPGATIYDTQDANPTPAVTLLLHSSATVVVDILVF